MTNETYPTDVSTLVVIDLLNDFLSEGGKACNNLLEREPIDDALSCVIGVELPLRRGKSRIRWRTRFAIL